MHLFANKQEKHKKLHSAMNISSYFCGKIAGIIWRCHTKALPLHADVLQITTKDMETTIVRRPASFRLRADLLEGLKRNAARANRSLNNYVESILLDIVYNEPNEETKEAIEEAMSGKNRNKTYTDVDEMLNDILSEHEE